MAVPSPCIHICRMHDRSGSADDWCEGCARTIDEIIAWGRMGDDAKRRVWELLPARRALQRERSAQPSPSSSSPKTAK